MRIKKIAALCFITSAILAMPAKQPLAAVGRTHGVPSVTPTGAAQYVIPLSVPPGTRNMQPTLSLSYSSRAGNGHFGVGWSLNGLSAISRCRSTWVQNGLARDVRNDASDRFCLDGNQLRLVSGAYGSAGAEYRTEVETFARIHSQGAAGNGPAYFTVEHKNGLEYQYGATDDSQILSVGQSTAWAWALNRIRDRDGNSILFTYTEDSVNGSFRIDRIDYTQNSDAGLAARYQVKFVYEALPVGETDIAYQANAPIRRITRVDRIDVTYDSALVRRYELTYEGSLSSTSRSRLASIQECAGTTPDCFSPTSFSYQNGTTGFGAEIGSGFAMPLGTFPWPLDVNGDGRKDLVYSSSDTSGAGAWMVALANAQGTYNAPFSTGVANTNFRGATPIDYNGDGLEDLLVPYSGGTWWVMLGTSGGMAAPFDTGAPATGTGANARAIDVNGDGLEDLVWADLAGFAGGDRISYRLREGAAFSSTVQPLLQPLPADSRLQDGIFVPNGQPFPSRTLDFNGDGRGDVVFRITKRIWNGASYVVGTTFNVICPGGMTFATDVTASDWPYYGDFNGDGRTDILYYAAGIGGGYRIRLSTGTGFTGEMYGPVSAGYGAPQLLADWDSDGNDDVLLRHVASGNLHMFRATGNGFAAAQDTGISAAGGMGGIVITDMQGDGLHDLGYWNSAGAWQVRSHLGLRPDLLLTATDGFGNSVTFNYAPLTSANYTKQASAVFPEQDYQGALHVVNSYTASDGIGGSYTVTHWYEGARMHLQGRGFEGFYSRRTLDSRNGLNKHEYFNLAFPYVGTTFQVDLLQPNNSTLIQRSQPNWTQHTYGAGYQTRHLPYISQTTDSQYEYGGPYNAQLLRTATTQNSVDATTGTLYDSTTTTTEGSNANGAQPGASSVERTYLPLESLVTDQATWCIGRPGQVQQIRSHAGVQITRTSSVSWDNCRVAQIINEPGHPQWQVTRILGYDAFGNVNSDSTVGIDMAARVMTVQWGATGQFPSVVTNALGQSTHLGWDPALGVQTSQTDPNQIAVEWNHDEFGRRTRENRADGTSTTWEYDDCAAHGCIGNQNRMVVVEAEIDSAGQQFTDRRFYVDGMDRLITASTRTLSGAYNRIDREYDALGRVHRESAPCWWASCAQYWSIFTYDALNRIVALSRPVSDSDATLQSTTIHHEGLTTRVVDALGHQSTKIADVRGLMVRSADHYNYTQNFEYDAFGQLLNVTDGVGNTLVTNTFNVRGMRTSHAELSGRSLQFILNALGEIVSQTDARNHTTTFDYDLLGRLRTRIEPEGTSTFTFGTSDIANEIGRLVSMSGPGYSETFEYETSGAGRLARRTIIADGTHQIEYDYDPTGALQTLTYPTSTAGHRLKLQYDYQNGHLLRVKDFNAPQTVFWTGNDTDPRGNVINETLGNGIQTIRGFDAVSGTIDYILSGPNANGAIQDLGYDWDRVGNLKQRRDLQQNLVEDFVYDGVYRLTDVIGPEPLTMGYDERGNITSRTGGSVSTSGHTAGWYSYDLPSTIQGADNSASEFFYAPDRSRWKQVASYGSSAETTVYIGGLVEKVTRGSTTTWKHYIAGASGPVALYTRDSAGTNALHYLTADHLGSIDTVTSVAGALEVRLSFSAFGRRRNAATWNGSPTSGDWSQIANTTRRGFTSHEMLDNLGLTHMNGRVYDPGEGVFMGADPIVQAPGNTQSFNRYSYVFNSPLSYVDPSGFSGLPVGPDDPDEGYNARPVPCQLGCSFLLPYWVTIFNYSEHTRPRPLVAVPLRRASTVIPAKSVSCDQMPCGNQVGPVRGAVGGTSVGQTIINSTVPGAYYGGQAELAFRDGRYLLGAAHSVASVLEAGIGVFTLGRSTAALSATRTVANTVPREVARVVAGNRNLTTLGRTGADDVFVTAADDIAGLNARQIAERLTIAPSETFTIIRFATPEVGLASPVFRTNPGFLQGGFTRGGAREFVIPNGPIPPGATIEVIGL